MDLTGQSFDDTTRMVALQSRATRRMRARLTRLTEPHILFPALALLFLGVVWGATFNLIRVERAGARTASSAAALQLVNTYEAQVVRALREIDQTLKVVKYADESHEAGAALSDLKARALLPPDVLFVVRIVGSDGVVLASTRPAQVLPGADSKDLSALRQSDRLWVDQPRWDPASQEWTLQFGRRLDAPDARSLARCCSR
jgi:hypothetical protein